MSFRGNYIAGGFVPVGTGELFASRNPARDHEVVLQARADVSAVEPAVAAAVAASQAWRRAPLETRVEALRRVQAKVPAHVERIAEAITAEMGKPIGEARAEAASVAPKIEGVVGQLAHALPPAAPGAPGEQRFHALGVVAVIGPYNFPVHLLNAHIIPALLTGNTVVAKPSEVTPLSGQRYAELFDDAGFPAGVFNLVHGLAETGGALVTHPDVSGVVFTGSYLTGRRIRQATFDQPFKKVCLELGGNNPAVVLDDADLDQATREILLGALLTAGQRCTATSRVIATPGIADALEARLLAAFRAVVPGDPTDAAVLVGPLAHETARERFLDALAQLRQEGAEALVGGDALPGGAFVAPALYRVSGNEPSLGEEVFGPFVAFERAADDDDALARAADSLYGLSAALFSARPEMLETFYDRVRVGVVNFNRSTNGASGLLPFGGVGRSGNWRPAGAIAPRLCTYPVAVMRADHGACTPHAALDALLESGG